MGHFCNVRNARVNPMTVWMPLQKFALACLISPDEVRARLRAAGLMDDAGAPTSAACEHWLAQPADGAVPAQWHADLVPIVRAIHGDRGGAGGGDRAGAGGGESRDAKAADHSVLESEFLFGVEDAVPASTVPPRVPAGTPSRVAGRREGLPPTAGAVVGHPPAGYDAVFATDGACSGNPGPGGWAWVNQYTGESDSGGVAATTNNIMELTAVRQVLEHVDPSANICLRIDSQYVINTVTKWARSWRAKGWKKADGKPVKNQELIAEILKLYESRRGVTDIVWVHGHDGDAGNELADTLAVAESQKF